MTEEKQYKEEKVQGTGREDGDAEMAVKTDDKPTDEEKKEGDKVRVQMKIKVSLFTAIFVRLTQDDNMSHDTDLFHGSSYV